MVMEYNGGGALLSVSLPIVGGMELGVEATLCPLLHMKGHGMGGFHVPY